ncbi:dihydroorotase [Aquimarina agarivorans]|uniref:dihydroorotase n=1 Tax=Aquimarina agarivorans TaxID=980584 RepID=UPI000248FC81|nr:dihydroorotase [Aquimarina agarivorans]
MNILLKSAIIIDPKSTFHNQKVDILIINGQIKAIKSNLELPDENIELIQLQNLHVSQGWFDSSVSFGEPGFEERETISNGLNTAAKSGFTALALQPNTSPIADNAAAISYVKNKSLGFATKIYPIGSLTLHGKGIDLAELFDMHSHHACSFGNYKQPIKNPNLLKLALQYTQGFGGLVQSYPQNNDVAGKGVVNENKNSTKLGLKGIPNLAEELQIARDLYILEYAGGKLHIPTISTAKSVELIKDAKSKGLDVSCSAAVHHLFFDDNALEDFDTNFKLAPPLRTKKDCDALISGLNDGIIDMITSDHCPMDIENKQVEFDNAAYGTTGLESAFSALLTKLPLEVIVDKLTAARNRFCSISTAIAEGIPANLSLFTPDGSFIFEKKHIHSTSKNSAFLNQKLKGKVYGIYANNQLVLND